MLLHRIHLNFAAQNAMRYHLSTTLSNQFGIMRDLHNAGLRGRLPLFIESFPCLHSHRRHIMVTYNWYYTI